MQARKQLGLEITIGNGFFFSLDWDVPGGYFKKSLSSSSKRLVNTGGIISEKFWVVACSGCQGRQILSMVFTCWINVSVCFHKDDRVNSIIYLHDNALLWVSFSFNLLNLITVLNAGQCETSIKSSHAPNPIFQVKIGNVVGHWQKKKRKTTKR